MTKGFSINFFPEIHRMRKFIKRVVYILFGLGILIWIVSFTKYQYLLKGVWATYLHGMSSANIDDKTYFSTELIRAENPVSWPENLKSGMQPMGALDSVLNVHRTVAFAVFQHDTLVYEEYATGYGRLSRTNSFSMAKTITAMLAEIAIENGDLSGWDQPVSELLPTLKGAYAADLTLNDLATMKAGLDWDEHYKNAFGITARAYYGEDVYNLMMEEVQVVDPPGETFRYQSGATQLLGLCVEAGTGRSLAELASSWLWTPSGAEDDAEWHLDDSGETIAYCCFNSNAADFARIGHILLHDGYWRGKLFMDSTAVRDFFRPISVPFYGRSIWLGEVDGISFSYLRGIQGQFVIIIPEAETVVVRLGHEMSTIPGGTTTPVIVSEAVKQYGR